MPVFSKVKNGVVEKHYIANNNMYNRKVIQCIIKRVTKEPNLQWVKIDLTNCAWLVLFIWTKLIKPKKKTENVINTWF